MDDDYDYDSGSQGEEEFNEDSLTNEEYDQLHDVLPELKARLESYNNTIPEFDMKQALYYNYFELEPTITELKSQFKKRMYSLSDFVISNSFYLWVPFR